MTRAVRVLSVLISAIVLIAAAVTAYVALTFSPKNYLPVLVTAVREATGRELHSDGQIGLKFFPCCAITLGETSLGNPPDFPAGDFARVRSAAVSLKLWPLLTRRAVEIGRVRLDGLAVELRERTDGRTSWEFGAGAGIRAFPSRDTGPGPGPATDVSVIALDLREASLHYHSDKNGADYLAENLNLRTGEIAAGKSTRIDADLRLTNTTRKIFADLKLGADIAIADEAREFRLRKPLLAVSAAGAGLPGSGLKAKFGAGEISYTGEETPQAVFHSVQIDIDLPGLKSPLADLSANFAIDDMRAGFGAATTLEAPVVRVDLRVEGKGIPGQAIDAKLQATKVTADIGQVLANVDALEATIHGLGATFGVTGRGHFGGDAGTLASGRLRIEPVSPRSLFAVFNKTAPVTSDPQALTRLSGSANWLLKPDFAGLSALDLQLDQTRISGSLRLPRAGQSSLAFDVHLGTLDADRYRAGDSTPSGTAAAVDAKAAATGDTELPLDTIRALHLEGRLLVDALSWSKLRMKNVSTRMQASGGRLRLDPLSAALYGGTLQGKVAVDATGATAKLALDQRLSAVKVGGALRDLYKSDKLEGELSGSLAVAATGRTTKQIWSSLSGPVALQLNKGTYRGTDIWYEIRRAQALLKRKDPPEKPAEAATQIDSLTLAGSMTNGVLHTTQLAGRMPFIDMSGQGDFNFVDDSLDCRLKAQVVQTPVFADGESLPGLTGVGIPLTLKGAMASPKVGVDINSLARSVITDKLENKLKDKVKDKLLGKFGDFLRK
jgi:AsmA protein